MARQMVTPDENSYNLATQVSVDNENKKQEARINQQRILPGAINTQALNTNIFSLSRVTSASSIVTNSTSSTFTGIVTNKFQQQIIAFPDVAVYIGIDDIEDISDSVQWPTQTVGGGNMPVFINPGNWGQTNGTTNSATSVTIRNNTGSNQLVLVVFQWRIITQPGASGGSITSS